MKHIKDKYYLQFKKGKGDPLDFRKNSAGLIRGFKRKDQNIPTKTNSKDTLKNYQIWFNVYGRSGKSNSIFRKQIFEKYTLPGEGNYISLAEDKYI